MRTDGTDLEFIFKKLKYPRPNDVTPMDFVGWLSDNHKVTIWGLDPGSTDLFVAADGSNQNAHRIRRTSTKEYYDLCGFKVANENRRIWRTEADLHQLSIIDGIPTIKTTDLQQLHRAITYRLQHFTLITSYYDLNFRFNVQKLKSYKGRQRGLSEIGRRLSFGSRKYGQPPSPWHNHMVDPISPTKAKWQAVPSIDRTNESEYHQIIAFGNGCWGNIRGKLSAPTKRLRQHLLQTSKLRTANISVVMIDEYNTSKICSKCRHRMKNVEERPSFHGHKERIHAVVKCDYCSTVWNRDVNAARNMRYLFIYMAMHGNERPEAFRRPTNTTPTNAEDPIGEEASML